MRKAEQPDKNEPTIHALRFAEAVQGEIDAEYVRLAGISGVDIADDWEHRLLEAVRGLATYPGRCIVATENDQFQQVHSGTPLRVLTYRRSRNSPTWRILFSVHEADTLDPPKVLVRHIWYAARGPRASWSDEDK